MADKVEFHVQFYCDLAENFWLHLINQPDATPKSKAVYICEDVPIGHGVVGKFCKSMLLAPCLWFIQGGFLISFWWVCSRAVALLLYLAFGKIVRFVLTGPYEI